MRSARPSGIGRQGKCAMREIGNVNPYQPRTGCQWDFLPHGAAFSRTAVGGRVLRGIRFRGCARVLGVPFSE
ncbi:hypothetical protein E4K73_46045 [Streptomyces sp. IB201691-2A2]|nr:hypothetical protein E4K73_46045 [Streptomyces sp. IB201691-2A2]